jgi:hypothetical protein
MSAKLSLSDILDELLAVYDIHQMLHIKFIFCGKAAAFLRSALKVVLSHFSFILLKIEYMRA